MSLKKWEGGGEEGGSKRVNVTHGESLHILAHSDRPYNQIFTESLNDVVGCGGRFLC